MAFVLYDIKTTRLHNMVYGSPKTYKTIGAARAALTRLVKKSDLDRDSIGIAEVNYFYSFVEKKVTRTNLMSGKEYTEGVNTPSYCSPASDAYWSM